MSKISIKKTLRHSVPFARISSLSTYRTYVLLLTYFSVKIIIANWQVSLNHALSVRRLSYLVIFLTVTKFLIGSTKPINWQVSL